MSRRKQSPFEVLAELTAMMPWWIGVLLALVSFFIFHHFASIKVYVSMNPGEFGTSMTKQLWVSLAFFGQIIIPAAFLIGAVVSAIRNRQSQSLFSSAAKNPTTVVNEISWSKFEMLVGEAFRRKGYSIIEASSGGPDGGVDIVLKKGNEKFFVQCKQWRAYNVPVNTVRELYGVMVARGAVGGFVVTSGKFTEDAIEFASGRNIELIDGPALDAMIRSVQPIPTNTSALPELQQPPKCPVCNSVMVMRTAKRGSNIGSQFWGCPKYPSCRGTLPL